MDKILFINACVRPCSRTLELAETLLMKLDGDVQEIKLYENPLPVLDLNGMEKRNRAAKTGDFSDPAFDSAKQFAAADVIVIAAPRQRMPGKTSVWYRGQKNHQIPALP